MPFEIPLTDIGTAISHQPSAIRTPRPETGYQRNGQGVRKLLNAQKLRVLTNLQKLQVHFLNFSIPLFELYRSSGRLKITLRTRLTALLVLGYGPGPYPLITE